MNLSWYLHRASTMRPAEIAGRTRDAVVAWRTNWQVNRLSTKGAELASGGFATPMNPLPALSDSTLGDLFEAAEQIAAGRIDVFGISRDDMATEPDWFLDVSTGNRAPSDELGLSIRYRDWAGSLKHVWEPSRHQHLTVLAAAAALAGRSDWGKLAEVQLDDWWRANQPFRGINWTSGIEIGIRLISWTWIRRLLDHVTEPESVFELNPEFQNQLYAHQLWLSRFPSRGTSANNHLVAEAAGLFVSACAFPIFPTSAKWRDEALAVLTREIQRQVGPDGIHRELATDYHAFVTELFMISAIEGSAAGHSPGVEYWETLSRMVDATAGMLDETGLPPRQGDSDDGHGLILDGYERDRWASILATGAGLFGPLEWWPEARLDVASTLLLELAPYRALRQGRPLTRPVVFEPSGMTILRTSDTSGREMWCRLDAGPMGYLSTASHGHDDALSIELHHDGVDVFADPGTYCYQSQPDWQKYFRSIRAHNTLEIIEAEPARQVGPFMWRGAPRSSTLEVSTSGRPGWIGSCIRKSRTGSDIDHVRAVTLDEGVVTISDQADQPVNAVLRFHLGPAVNCVLEHNTARLSWSDASDGRDVEATLELPASLRWTIRAGETNPIAGWYSARFGDRTPIVTLEGAGQLTEWVPVVTKLTVEPTSRDASDGVEVSSSVRHP